MRTQRRWRTGLLMACTAVGVLSCLATVRGLAAISGYEQWWPDCACNSTYPQPWNQPSDYLCKQRCDQVCPPNNQVCYACCDQHWSPPQFDCSCTQ